MKKLLIISHTEHYKNTNGLMVGWGPTVTEINNLALVFDEIYHIAPLHTASAPPSAIEYSGENIYFVPIKPSGGKTLSQKLAVLFNAPATIAKIHKILKKVDIFQFRAPTGIGVFMIPYLTLFIKQPGWYKYAGNWNQKNAPLGYGLQRWFLKKQKRKVTINGSWENQSAQCLSFENPCLTEIDRSNGWESIEKKEFKTPFTYCFAGRLEDAKGVRRIIEAFSLLKHKLEVKEVHLIGDGTELSAYKELAEKSGVSFVFHGFRNREQVFAIFKKSHYFLLPSTASEGFPKVISEAMNFGCIPIVSRVSSIGQFVQHKKNGLIVSPVSSEVLCTKINESFLLPQEEIDTMQAFNHKLGKKFTYKYYTNRILNEIVE